MTMSDDMKRYFPRSIGEANALGVAFDFMAGMRKLEAQAGESARQLDEISRGILALAETPVDACSHPELNMQDDPLYGRVYWCGVCKKKIIVPNHTLTGSDAQERLGGIIGLAFGEKWGKLATEGRV